ncbi:MAG: vWA domain-containing protein [Chloroflexota bacterium]
MRVRSVRRASGRGRTARAPRVARLLASLLAGFFLCLQSLVAVAASICGPMDTALVLDTTSSMHNSIENAKAELQRVVDAVERASGGDYRLALVTFTDEVVVQVPLAERNADAIRTRLRTITAQGGGASTSPDTGEPEASDEALRTVIHALAERPGQRGSFADAFRPDVNKVAILVTDSRPGGFDDRFTAGVDDVSARQVAVDARDRGIKIASLFMARGSNSPVERAARSAALTYAQTTGAAFAETHPNGRGTADALREVIDACGADRGAGSTFGKEELMSLLDRILRRFERVIEDTFDLAEPMLPFMLISLLTFAIWRRNELVMAIRAAFRLLALPAVIPARGLVQVLPTLERWKQEALDGLVYRAAHNGHAISQWTAWLFINPVISALLLAVMLTAELALTTMRLAALYGIDLGPRAVQMLGSLPVDIEVLSGLQLAVIGLIFGAVIVDILRGTPFGSPWGNFSDKVQRMLLIGAVVGLALTAVDLLVLYFWSQMKIPGVWVGARLVSMLPHLFVILLAVLFTAATFYAGWAVYISSGAFWGLGLIGFHAGAWLARLIARGLAAFIEVARRLVTWIIDLMAWLPHAIWNYYLHKAMRADKVVKWEPKAVDFDVNDPLFPEAVIKREPPDDGEVEAEVAATTPSTPETPSTPALESPATPAPVKTAGAAESGSSENVRKRPATRVRVPADISSPEDLTHRKEDVNGSKTPVTTPK